jgi:hypothetical protein
MKEKLISPVFLILLVIGLVLLGVYNINPNFAFSVGLFVIGITFLLYGLFKASKEGLKGIPILLIIISIAFLGYGYQLYPGFKQVLFSVYDLPENCQNYAGVKASSPCAEDICTSDYCTVAYYDPNQKECTKSTAMFGQVFKKGQTMPIDSYYCNKGWYRCQVKWSCEGAETTTTTTVPTCDLECHNVCLSDYQLGTNCKPNDDCTSCVCWNVVRCDYGCDWTTNKCKSKSETCTDWEFRATCAKNPDGWYYITKEVRECDGEIEIRNREMVKCSADQTCDTSKGGCVLGYCVKEGKKYKIGETFGCHCVQARPGKIECFYCSDTLNIKPIYKDCPGEGYYCADGKCHRIAETGCGNGICEPGEDYKNCYTDCHMYDGICQWTSPGDGTPGTIADYENCKTDPEECKCPDWAPICLPSGDCGKEDVTKCKHEGEPCGGYGALAGVCCVTENLICKEEGAFGLPLVGELFKTTLGVCKKKTIWDDIPYEIVLPSVLALAGFSLVYMIVGGRRGAIGGMGVGIAIFFLVYKWMTMPGWERLLITTFGGIGIFLYGSTIVSILLFIGSILSRR